MGWGTEEHYWINKQTLIFPSKICINQVIKMLISFNLPSLLFYIYTDQKRQWVSINRCSTFS